MSKTVDILGGQAEYYLNHTCKTIDKQLIHIPGPDIVGQKHSDIGEFADFIWTWTFSEYRLCIHPTCRPGYRAFCWGIFRSQSTLF